MVCIAVTFFPGMSHYILKLLICNTFTASATLRRAPLWTKKIQRIQVGFAKKSRSDLFNSIEHYPKKINQSMIPINIKKIL